MRYLISFQVTLSTSRVVEANSEDEAMDLAYQAADDEDFRYSLIDDLDHDYEAFGDITPMMLDELSEKDPDEVDWPVR